MLVEKTPLKNLCCIRLNPGDDVLASLTEAVEKQGIKNAIIICGMGSTINHHFHVVATGNLPPGNLYTKADKASDVLNMNGMIINGRVHAHITHSDEKIAYGGHLEDGVKVCTFLQVTLAVVDIDLADWDSLGRIEDFRKK